jgi:hypothetical protein
MAGKKAKLALFFGLCWNHPGYPKPIAHVPMELSMLVQDYLRDIKAVSGDWFPSLKFLIMFIGAVVGPLVLLVVGGRDSGTLSVIGLAWSFLAIALGESSFYQPEAHLKVMWGNVFVHSGHRKETRS